MRCAPLTDVDPFVLQMFPLIVSLKKMRDLFSGAEINSANPDLGSNQLCKSAHRLGTPGGKKPRRASESPVYVHARFV